MDTELISSLVDKASKLGAQGYHVISWLPPQSASSDPEGTLICRREATPSAAQKPWYES
jgi:hypothetical protein